MKVELNPDKDFVTKIKSDLKANGMHCPCQIPSDDTICMCKDFRENVEVGGWCICELYRKK